jgi:hypothetical protein
VPLALYPHSYSGCYNLYTGRMHIPVLHRPEQVDHFLAQGAGSTVLTSQESYRDLAPRLATAHALLDAGRVGHREIVFLVSSVPAARR